MILYMNKYNQIHTQVLSASAKGDSYLLICNGRYYEASAAVVELLDCLKRTATRDEAIAAYIRTHRGLYTPEQVEKLIDTYVDPLLSESGVAAKRTFIYDRELLPAKMIDRFSDTFSFLFLKPVFLPVIFLALLADGLFLFTADDLLVFNGRVNSYSTVGLFLFMLCSSFFHELGHASACKHYGVNHGGIGFGLYMNFPVLYTDVTEVWRLGRKQRCMVNIAGVYFQMYLLLIVLSVYWWTGSDLARYMALMLNLGFFMTLNPFFKFDGYWLVSDILGVPNLRSRSREWLIYLWRKLRKKAVGCKPYLLKIGKLPRWGLAIYSVVVNLFMAYYLFYVLPGFIAGLAQSFPSEVKQLVMYVSNDLTPPFAVIRNVIMQFVLLALVVFWVFNFVRSMAHVKRRQ